MKKLYLRKGRTTYSIGYYDKCSCGFACDKHFRVIRTMDKIQYTEKDAQEALKQLVSKEISK